MSILESYKKKLEGANELKRLLNEIDVDLEDKIYIRMDLENKIREYERRLQRLTSVGEHTQCDICKQWVLYEERDTVKNVDGYTICQDCCGSVSKVLMSQEAEERWNLPTGRIKQDCRRGMLDEYIEIGLIRKAGKYWLIHELVGTLYYEKKKQKNEA